MAPSMMQRHLIHVLEARLDEAGYGTADVARHANGLRGISESALSRLVRGEATHSRLGMDAVVDAYTALLDTEPIDIWREALARWAQDPAGEWLDEAEAQLVARRRARRLRRVPAQP